MENIILELTKEEAEELQRTLIGRLDLDLTERIKECSKVVDGKVVSVNEERLATLLFMKKQNQSILNKVTNAGINVFSDVFRS